MLSLKSRSLMDYAAGIALLSLPPAFHWEYAPARNVFLLCGILLVTVGLVGRAPFALWKALPFGCHRLAEFSSGLALVLAPWALGYRPLISSDQEFLHYGAGAALMAYAALVRARVEAAEDREEPVYPARFSSVRRKRQAQPPQELQQLTKTSGS